MMVVDFHLCIYIYIYISDTNFQTGYHGFLQELQYSEGKKRGKMQPPIKLFLFVNFSVILAKSSSLKSTMETITLGNLTCPVVKISERCIWNCLDIRFVLFLFSLLSFFFLFFFFGGGGGGGVLRGIMHSCYTHLISTSREVIKPKAEIATFFLF